MAMSLGMHTMRQTLLVSVLISSYKPSYAISAGSKALIVDSQDIHVSFGPTGLVRDILNSSCALVLRQEQHKIVSLYLNLMKVYDYLL